MSEQTVLNYKAQLEAAAAEIKTQSNLAAAKATAVENQLETIENLKAGLLNTVLNARFEINNKLQHTNEDQRRAALSELKSTDRDYKTAVARLRALEEQKKTHESEAEFQRKKFRAAELAMLFYAHNPT